MSTNLIEQIEDYFAQVEAQQAPVMTEEVNARLGSVTATRPRRSLNRRGLLVAAVSAILVLLAGFIPLLLTGDETPTADTVDNVPNSTIAPPTTNPTPSTTPLEEGFAPRLEGSGVDVTFGMTPIEMEIVGSNFVVMEAEWSIDWEAVAWEWGDDEVRQRIALGASLGGNYVFRAPNTLIFVDDVQNSLADPFERFTLSFSGTADDFEIDVSKESTGEHLVSVTGSLPGLDEEEILRRVANARTGTWEPSRAGWYSTVDNGELTPLDPPWQPFWGAGYFEPDPFFEVGDFTLALFDVDLGATSGWYSWRTVDGYEWEALGLTPWNGAIPTIDVIAGELVVDAFDTYWTTGDGVEWVELSETEYAAKTGNVVVDAEDIPEAPDPWFPESLDRNAIDARFEELAQNAVVINEDPLIFQLLPGPEPRFDTAQLGDEIPFELLTKGDPRIQWLVQMIAEDQDPGPKPDGPLLFVGHVTDEAMALTYDDMRRGALWSLKFAADCRFECLGIEGLQAAGELDGDIWLDHSDIEVQVLVPDDTAVVVVRYNADNALWQRPTGSWAFFPGSVDGDDTYWVDAYDVDGKLIATTETR